MLLVTYVKSLGESKQVRHIVVLAVESEEESLVPYDFYIEVISYIRTILLGDTKIELILFLTLLTPTKNSLSEI